MTTMDLETSWSAVEATVRGYLHRRLDGDGATADDLAQEVFLRLRHNLEGLRSADRLGPWVTLIARSVLIDHLRRQRGMAPVDGLEAAQPETDGEDVDDLAALSAYLYSQVGALPEHEAVAIRMVDLDGLASSEAAVRLGIRLPALKARLRRGRLRLRQAIDRCCAVSLDGRGHPINFERRTGFSAPDCCGPTSNAAIA
jgi:RNA polymerase sigma-70 factor (ECF subfamily)